MVPGEGSDTIRHLGVLARAWRDRDAAWRGERAHSMTRTSTFPLAVLGDVAQLSAQAATSSAPGRRTVDARLAEARGGRINFHSCRSWRSLQQLAPVPRRSLHPARTEGLAYDLQGD